MWSQQPEASPSPSPVGNPSAPRWTSCSLIQPLQSPGPQRITSPGRHDSIDSNWSQKATEKAVFFIWFIYVYICLKQCSEIYPQPVYDKIGSTTKGVYPQAVQAFPRWIKEDPPGTYPEFPENMIGLRFTLKAGFWTSILVMKWLSKLSWYGTRKWLL